MYKILITGHTGFVGKSVCEAVLKQGYQVLGLSRTGCEIEGIINFPRDLTQIKTYDFLDQYAIHGIIHLAANSDLNNCEEDPVQSGLINVNASIGLAKYAKKRHIPFIFASTDQVFDGAQGNYSPEDDANPLNQYGTQKLQAEQEVLKICPQAVICRLPLMIGANGGYEKALLENLKAGKEQTLFTDEIRSVAKVEDVALALVNALESKSGIYHLGGPKPINRYELGKLLAEKYGLNQSLIKPGLQSDVQMKAKRPKNVSLINSPY
jgi:dTDP-4-dehydrorhamnose reductase